MSVPGRREVELVEQAERDAYARKLGIRPGYQVRAKVAKIRADYARLNENPADDVQALNLEAEKALATGELAAEELRMADQAVNN